MSQPTFQSYDLFAVRLSRGDHSHGVVQIMEESWAVLCGEGFTNKEAKVVCRQLGFQDGMSLALGSFGTFYGRYVRPNITCNGTEKSILDCKYDEFRGCQKDSFLGYAVVSCFNGKPSKGIYWFSIQGRVHEILYFSYTQTIYSMLMPTYQAWLKIHILSGSTYAFILYIC